MFLRLHDARRNNSMSAGGLPPNSGKVLKEQPQLCVLNHDRPKPCTPMSQQDSGIVDCGEVRTRSLHHLRQM
jgi:hypothetical protein